MGRYGDWFSSTLTLSLLQFAMARSGFRSPLKSPTATESMDHCFTNGNKRVAWTSTMHVLHAYGLTVDAATDEDEALMLSIIHKSLKDGMKVGGWLAEPIIAAE